RARAGARRAWRPAVLAFLRLAVLLIGLASLPAACGVGSVARDEGGPDVDGGIDGQGGGGGGRDAAPPGADGGRDDCVPAEAEVDDGHHNPGQPCMSCHGKQGPGPRWYVAGTLYADLAGSEPVAGATILVTDADGETRALVTAQNGNFWSPDPVAYPLQVVATSCPDRAEMLTAVPMGGGSCNKSGCHAEGNRIHLP